MPQAVNAELFLYADDSGLKFQHKDVHTIEHQLTMDFNNSCEWFVDNKLKAWWGFLSAIRLHHAFFSYSPSYTSCKVFGIYTEQVFGKKVTWFKIHRIYYLFLFRSTDMDLRFN